MITIFQASLIFSKKDGAYPSGAQDTAIMVRLQAILEIALKNLTLSNTLAYFGSSLNDEEKKVL
jgi:hypothetical protein